MALHRWLSVSVAILFIAANVSPSSAEDDSTTTTKEVATTMGECGSRDVWKACLEGGPSKQYGCFTTGLPYKSLTGKTMSDGRGGQMPACVPYGYCWNEACKKLNCWSEECKNEPTTTTTMTTTTTTTTKSTSTSPTTQLFTVRATVAQTSIGGVTTPNFVAEIVFGILFALLTLVVFLFLGITHSRTAPERKASLRTIVFTDELGAIKALNWQHPLSVSSKILAVIFLLFGWIFIVASKIGITGPGNYSLFAMLADFGCMLANIWFIYKYVIEGGFDRHCWHREFVVNTVVTGLLFISCCMVSSTGTSLGKQKKMASSISQLFGADTKVKVPGLAVLNAGVAFSWFGLVAMAISLFGSWTKRKSDDGADTAANGLTSHEDGELNSEGVNGGATNIDDGTANNDDCGGSGELNGAAYTSNPEAVLAGDTDAHSI